MSNINYLDLKYKEKYIKYKLKYKTLKQLEGGARISAFFGYGNTNKNYDIIIIKLNDSLTKMVGGISPNKTYDKINSILINTNYNKNNTLVNIKLQNILQPFNKEYIDFTNSIQNPSGTYEGIDYTVATIFYKYNSKILEYYANNKNVIDKNINVNSIHNNNVKMTFKDFLILCDTTIQNIITQYYKSDKQINIDTGNKISCTLNKQIEFYVLYIHSEITNIGLNDHNILYLIKYSYVT